MNKFNRAVCFCLVSMLVTVSFPATESFAGSTTVKPITMKQPGTATVVITSAVPAQGGTIVATPATQQAGTATVVVTPAAPAQGGTVVATPPPQATSHENNSARNNTITEVKTVPALFSKGEQVEFVIVVDHQGPAADGFTIQLRHVDSVMRNSEGKIVGQNVGVRLISGNNVIRIRQATDKGEPGMYIVNMVYRGAPFGGKSFRTFDKPVTYYGLESTGGNAFIH